METNKKNISVEETKTNCGQIIKLEFEIQLKDQKNNNAPRMDGMQTEIFKFSGEEATNRLFKLVSSVHKIEKVPEDFKKGILETLLNNVGAGRCEIFRSNIHYTEKNRS